MSQHIEDRLAPGTYRVLALDIQCPDLAFGFVQLGQNTVVELSRLDCLPGKDICQRLLKAMLTPDRMDHYQDRKQLLRSDPRRDFIADIRTYGPWSPDFPTACWSG